MDNEVRLPIKTTQKGDEISKVCVEDCYKIVNRVVQSMDKAYNNSIDILDSIHKKYDGYAGAKGVKIDRLQIVPCKPKDVTNLKLLGDDEFKCIYAYSSKLNYNLLLLFLIIALI